jgi:hypothetical protein
MVRTLSVLQAIQEASDWELAGTSAKEERYGISWMPTLKSGRGRRLGMPDDGSKGRRELGKEASKDKSYTTPDQRRNDRKVIKDLP